MPLPRRRERGPRTRWLWLPTVGGESRSLMAAAIVISLGVASVMAQNGTIEPALAAGDYSIIGRLLLPALLFLIGFACMNHRRCLLVDPPRAHLRERRHLYFWWPATELARRAPGTMIPALERREQDWWLVIACRQERFPIRPLVPADASQAAALAAAEAWLTDQVGRAGWADAETEGLLSLLDGAGTAPGP